MHSLSSSWRPSPVRVCVVMYIFVPVMALQRACNSKPRIWRLWLYFEVHSLNRITLNWICYVRRERHCASVCFSSRRNLTEVQRAVLILLESVRLSISVLHFPFFTERIKNVTYLSVNLQLFVKSFKSWASFIAQWTLILWSVRHIHLRFGGISNCISSNFMNTEYTLYNQLKLPWFNFITLALEMWTMNFTFSQF